MVSSVGAYAGDIMQFFQLQNRVETSQCPSFEDLVGNGTISVSNDDTTGITAMGGGSSSGSSTSSNSEMDLNNDGVVTIDEIMRYTEMQMMERMQEQVAEEQSSDAMSHEAEKGKQNESFDLNSFKTQMATKAYQMGQDLLTASIGAVTQSFAL